MTLTDCDPSSSHLYSPGIADIQLQMAPKNQRQPTALHAACVATQSEVAICPKKHNRRPYDLMRRPLEYFYAVATLFARRLPKACLLSLPASKMPCREVLVVVSGFQSVAPLLLCRMPKVCFKSLPASVREFFRVVVVVSGLLSNNNCGRRGTQCINNSTKQRQA